MIARDEDELYRSASKRSGARRSRRIAFRALAILVGFLPFVIGEVGLRIAGWGHANEVEDPYIGFTEIHPLFVLNRAAGRYEIPASRQALFRAESFSSEKEKQEFRIFCLGGSTVQGRPYAIETSFTSWLEVNLRAADPSRHWEVVNCGGVSYASYRLLPIMHEILAYEPDLFVIYTGHNEFLEARTYQSIRETPAGVFSAHVLMSNLRIYNVARKAWLRSSGQLDERPQLRADAAPLLDYRGGLEAYQRNDEQRQAIVQHFRHSLQRIVQIARQAGVPVLLCNPIANLKNTPPFKVQPGDNLTADQIQEFALLYDTALSHEHLEPHERLKLWQKAIGIDDRHAGAYFHLGQCLLELGQPQQAKWALLRAKDEDICPLRILESMHEVIHAVAEQMSIPLVDVRQRFEGESPHEIPGSEWLIDHVHPTIDGHQLIAERLLEELIALHIVVPAADWQERRDELVRRHRQGLPEDYFAEAEERIQGLRRWTEGRAFQTPDSPGFVEFE